MHIYIYTILYLLCFHLSDQCRSWIRDLVTPIATEIRIKILIKRNPIWEEAEEETTQEMRKSRREP